MRGDRSQRAAREREGQRARAVHAASMRPCMTGEREARSLTLLPSKSRVWSNGTVLIALGSPVDHRRSSVLGGSVPSPPAPRGSRRRLNKSAPSDELAQLTRVRDALGAASRHRRGRHCQHARSPLAHQIVRRVRCASALHTLFSRTCLEHYTRAVDASPQFHWTLSAAATI